LVDAVKKNTMVYVAIVAILVVAAVGVAWWYTSSGTNNGSPLIGTLVGSAQLSRLKAVALDTSLANNIGAGTTTNGGHPNYPIPVNSSNLIVVNGKPGIVYISADYCPYCAITRWGLIIALLRFGDFTGLKYMTSSPSDVAASTPTFTFTNSSYYSSSLYLYAVETGDINGKTIASPNALESAVFSKYDSGGAIPFTDLGNSSVLVGSMVLPQLLDGKSWDQIIAQLNQTSSPVSQAVIGSANIFTAYICRMNSSIGSTAPCQQSYVKSINGVTTIGKG